jgi:hypothetical protein
VEAGAGCWLRHQRKHAQKQERRRSVVATQSIEAALLTNDMLSRS